MTAQTAGPPRVAITGASGLVGSALVAALRASGSRVQRLVRGAPRTADDVRWDSATGTIDAAGLEGVDAIVNLAGEPIAQRWNPAVRARIRGSRVEGTALLARAIVAMAAPPRLLLSGSAVGIYGDRKDEMLDEASAPGADWLAQVARDWEEAAIAAESARTRVITLRTGVVLSPHGGVLARLLPPFRLGLGGPLGDGMQWMSWISLTDMVEAILFLIHAGGDGVRGAVNLVAPEPVRNRDFAHTMGRVLHRPALIPVPKVALRAAFEGMADATLLASQRAIPRRLSEAGYRFRFPDLEPALRHELAT
ncbi:MAG: TIGR01777 family oxidoreductase [Gemmatimonadaceae bacterium]